MTKFKFPHFSRPKKWQSPNFQAVSEYFRIIHSEFRTLFGISCYGNKYWKKITSGRWMFFFSDLLFSLSKKFAYMYIQSKHDITNCENTFIPWHQLSWFLQNALIPGFLNSWFHTLQATINGKIVFKWTTKSTKIILSHRSIFQLNVSWIILIFRYITKCMQ
jgi:hypothetical protein